METPPDPDASHNSRQQPPTNQSESSMDDNEETPDIEVRIQIDNSTGRVSDDALFQRGGIASPESDRSEFVSNKGGSNDPIGTTSNESQSGVISPNHETTLMKQVVVGEEGNDDDDDLDDRIDIRDNANDEDQFAFEDNNVILPGAGVADSIQQGLMNEMIPSEQADGDDVNDDDDNQEAGANAATNRVAEEDDIHHEYHYDHHHLDDRFHGSSSESHEEESEYYSHDEKSLDVLLLEEICEEAANMTIKEALIHSLKPNVRAGLTTAHLRLSESEILSLEGYCEDFVGGLIKDLLKRTSLLQITNAETQNNAVDQAAVVKTTAKHLSKVDMKQLKVYCDHFVHSVIAESIIDSSMMVTKQRHKADLVKKLLEWFQGSEELQEYFTSLTTDIVRTALINVVTKEESEEIESQSTDQLDSSTLEGSESLEHTSYSDDQEFDNYGDEDFDFDDDHSFGFPLPNSDSPSMHGADDDQAGHNREFFQKRGAVKHGKSTHHAEDTSLEFDMDWVQGVLHDVSSTDGERRQKIVIHELEFDDHANVGGTELLAPVFLAIAEENEDDSEFQGMRRKTQSIENLCELIEEEKEPPRKRSSSHNQTNPKRTQRFKRDPPSWLHKPTQPTEEKTNIEDEPDQSSSSDVEADQAETQRQSPMSFDVTKALQDKVYHAYDNDQFRWHTIRVNNREKVLDLRLIEPYMKVITHGGVHMPSRAIIVVIAACYLPEKSKKNYDFLMEQLFFYMISTLELLATADEYFLVYFNGGTTHANMPALPWMKRFYQHIEAGLKQNMIKMLIVHPNLWLKTIIRFARAFVGTNFWAKLQFIKSLDDLSAQIPTEFMYIPDDVIRSDPKYKRLHNL